MNKQRKKFLEQLQKYKKGQKQEPSLEQTGIEPKSHEESYQRKMEQLSAPYEETEAFEIFGKDDEMSLPGEIGSDRNPSVFWNTDINYVQKYKNAPLAGDAGTRKEADVR